MGLTNEQVAQRWVNGRAGKSSNGNMETDGENLYSYNMRIGRTLAGNVKQVLDVRGYHSYSVTTSSHVLEAVRAAGWHVPTMLPMDGENGLGYGKTYRSGWRSFQNENTIEEVRVTAQSWKTFNGAQKALARSNNPVLFVKQLRYSGDYSLYTRQHVNSLGLVVSAEEYHDSAE